MIYDKIILHLRNNQQGAFVDYFTPTKATSYFMNKSYDIYVPRTFSYAD